MYFVKAWVKRHRGLEQKHPIILVLLINDEKYIIIILLVLYYHYIILYHELINGNTQKKTMLYLRVSKHSNLY